MSLKRGMGLRIKIIIISILFPLSISPQSYVDIEDGHECVDLGLSVKWATCNVGAKKPHQSGIYYAWGETKEKYYYFTWKSYKFWQDGNNSDDVKFTKYNTDSLRGRVDNHKYLKPEDDVAHVDWGGAWRIPSFTEIQELIENCTWEWTTLKRVKGFKVSSKKSGYTDRFIFLPAGGFRTGNKIYGEGYCGCYWTCNLDLRGCYGAYSLIFPLSVASSYQGDRSYGQSVRPVWDPKM